MSVRGCPSQKFDSLDVLVKALVESKAAIIVSVHIEETKLEAVAYSERYHEEVVLVCHPVEN